jgi:hypothetical protein
MLKKLAKGILIESSESKCENLERFFMARKSTGRFAGIG